MSCNSSLIFSSAVNRRGATQSSTAECVRPSTFQRGDASLQVKCGSTVVEDEGTFACRLHYNGGVEYVASENMNNEFEYEEGVLTPAEEEPRGPRETVTGPSRSGQTGEEDEMHDEDIGYGKASATAKSPKDLFHLDAFFSVFE